MIPLKKTKTVFLDGIHTAVLDINYEKKTVIANIITDDITEYVYAENFDDICDYEKMAVKACVAYLNEKGKLQNKFFSKNQTL